MYYIGRVTRFKYNLQPSYQAHAVSFKGGLIVLHAGHCGLAEEGGEPIYVSLATNVNGAWN